MLDRVRVVGCLAVVVLAACGPIEYVSNVTFQAQRAIEQAKLADAARYAPYEWTMAQEHLYKARELGGYARFQEAISYGKTATAFGRQAESVAQSRSGRDPSMAPNSKSELRDGKPASTPEGTIWKPSEKDE